MPKPTIPSRRRRRLPTVIPSPATLAVTTLGVILLALPLSHAGEAQVCYYPDGGIASDYNYVPCNIGSEYDYAPCCTYSKNDVCMPNGLCNYTSAGSSYTYRGACTDPTWMDPSCPRVCQGIRAGDIIRLNACSPIEYCCANADSDCCTDGSEIFTLAPIDARQSAATVTETVFDPSLPTANPDQKSQPSQSSPPSALRAGTIGAAVGAVGAAVIIAIIGGLIFCCRRRRKRQRSLDAAAAAAAAAAVQSSKPPDTSSPSPQNASTQNISPNPQFFPQQPQPAGPYQQMVQAPGNPVTSPITYQNQVPISPDTPQPANASLDPYSTSTTPVGLVPPASPPPAYQHATAGNAPFVLADGTTKEDIAELPTGSSYPFRGTAPYNSADSGAPAQPHPVPEGYTNALPELEDHEYPVQSPTPTQQQQQQQRQQPDQDQDQQSGPGYDRSIYEMPG